MLFYVIGKILRTEGLLMILPLIVSLIYKEKSKSRRIKYGKTIVNRTGRHRCRSIR